MLKQLLKYEFKATKSLYFGLYLALALLSACGDKATDDKNSDSADDKVITVRTAHPLGTTVLTIGCGVFALVAEVHQGGQVIVRHKDDVAAAAAVTAVRATRRHEFFAVEGHRAVAALAGVQPDRGGINKITGCHCVPL